MPSSCSIRALWILNNQDTVVFSRRFSVVERRWSVACKKANEKSTDNQDSSVLFSSLPTDLELAAAFADRKKREGSAHGYGIRVKQSIQGSDSWVDDPIMRHIVSLHVKKEEDGEDHTFWPFVLHTKGQYYILVLPFVEPVHFKAYSIICRRPDCGNAVGVDGSLSSLLLQLPCITGLIFLYRAFMVAHVLGDIITSDIPEPEVVVSAAPSVGGLLDSLTGSIGISARPKPVAAPVAASTNSSTVAGSSGSLDSPKIGPRNPEKDALRSFISTAMPFGTPLDISYSNISAIRTSGFSSADVPPVDSKQPAWKPYLFKGKQRLLFTIHEIVNATMYDRDEIPDSLSISGQVNCRAELDGLPDVLFPLKGLNSKQVEILSFHPCAQVPEQQGGDKQSVMFSPPLGNFVLLRYQAYCSLGIPIKGFYQLSMVSENEGAFLFKLSLMEGYKSPLTMEFCTVTMPFPRRKVLAFEGTPSIGTVSHTDHSVEWKIITSGRGVGAKSIEATFPGTVKFAPWKTQRPATSGSLQGIIAEEDSDTEMESANNMVNVEEYLMEKMNKDLPAVDLEEPFCWQAYNYAKVSFKMGGTSLSGMTIDSKSVNIFPSAKVPVEFSTQVHSGDYILWNTLGKVPVAATPKN
ncbi:AP-5 complex subunit mu isoform X1 [Cynara cardunculus var. scolymus]|uniref:AP-5 complex subunit mu isoform X1 n=1 Tax=Cynara cardunculus var. scolymus TaxID=59895 RepID=UPI000D62502B|nr:AP-5 complex subunit mu isoform X1 [Cynara cardunculus var. scolymus]